MATIKLGAIITSIAGSIGGSTFRRGSNFISVYNKQNRQSKSSSNVNSRIGQISHIVKLWSGLSELDRESWEKESSRFIFLDKFGNEKTLTGRQLFNKLNGQLLPAEGFNANASGIDSNVSVPLIKTIECSLAYGYINLEFVNKIFDSKTYFKFIRRANAAQTYISPSRKVDHIDQMDGADTTDLFFFINKQFQGITAGQIFTVQVFNVNTFGFLSQGQSITFTVV